MNDIQSANQLKQSIQIQYDDIKQEREQLTRLAQELQMASDKLSKRDADVSDMIEALCYVMFSNACSYNIDGGGGEIPGRAREGADQRYERDAECLSGSGPEGRGSHVICQEARETAIGVRRCR